MSESTSAMRQRNASSHHEVAHLDGVGTSFVVTVSGAHPDNRFNLRVFSGGLGGGRGRLLLEGVSWTQAMARATDEIARELRAEGASDETVGPFVQRHERLEDEGDLGEPVCSRCSCGWASRPGGPGFRASAWSNHHFDMTGREA